MTIYSHSRLNTFENCPFQYKLRYIDRVKVDKPASIEAFVGSRVHETLEKLYKDLLMEKLNSKEETLKYFNDLWEKHWDDDILIVKEGYSEENYRKTGERCLSNYYDSHKPFNHSKTLGIEDYIILDLDGTGKYKLRGYIDRVAQKGSTYEIHDYKTSSRLPLQKHLDEDRQLALYSIGIKERFPDAENVELIWHYVAFDKDLKSTRTDDKLEKLKKETIELIVEIESTKEFKPNESRLCDWCDYQEHCPKRKHLVETEELSPNKYLNEEGVSLVNKYVEIYTKKKEAKNQISEKYDSELEDLKEALIQYAKKKDVSLIGGSDMDANISISKRFKFPGASDKERAELEELVKAIGKWDEVSSLNLRSLGKAYENWKEKKKIEKYAEEVESTRVSLRKKG